MRHALAFALVAGAALAGAAHAVDVYKWTDSKGVVHYGDRPASGVPATVVSARDDRVDPEEAERAKQRLAGSHEQLPEDVDDDVPAAPRRPFTPRPAPTGCAAEWQRYQAAQACFDAHRAAGGKGVTARGSMVCKDVPQPSCTR